MYGEVVAGIDKQAFESELNGALARSQITNPAELPVEALVELVEIFKDVLVQESDELFLQDPREQVRRCVGAVFELTLPPFPRHLES